MISSSPSKRVAKATGYLVFMEQLAATCATASESRVEIDERIVTSRGPGTTIEFSLTLIEQLYEKEKAGSTIVLPLFSGNGILSRLSSIFLGFAPPFLLLSIGYEAVFYSALAVVLMAWILFENASHHSSKVKDSSLSDQNREEHVTIGSDEREIHEREA